jgi:hypothetical protein
MKTVLQIIVFLNLLLAITTCAFAKEWRGIIPYRSTREDVEKLLGQPPPPPSDRAYYLGPSRSIYFLDEGEVYIVYANKSSRNEEIEKCLDKMPEGTVLYIQITPKKELRVWNLEFTLKKAEVFNPTPQNGNIGYKGYLDKKEGVVVSTYDLTVVEIVYIATSKDKRLCPNFYQDPKSLVSLYLHT